MRSTYLGALLTLALVLGGCSGNDAIPKLVPLEHFEKQEVRQDITDTSFIAPKVDILIVIDGSGSMGVHIQNVEANIDKFIDQLVLANLDYRIAITIAGHTREANHRHLYPDLRAPSNSGLFHTNQVTDQPPYYVTQSTPNVVDVLKSRVRVGTANDARETFFGPILDAIAHAETSDANRDFFRTDAFLIPITIADADDQTAGEGIRLMEVKDFYDQLVAFKGRPELIIPFSVLIPTAYGNNPPCSRGGEPAPHRIEEFLDLANGFAYDLCSPDFGVQLATLGEDLSKRVTGSLQLLTVPDPRTITVSLGDRVLPNDPRKGWTYNPETNRIHLGREIEPHPDPNARFHVQYVPANTFRN